MNYPWLPAGDALDRTWNAAGYAEVAPRLGGAIVVEAGVRADQAGQEIAFTQTQAAAQPWILGVVAQAPAGDPPALKKALGEIVGNGFVVGIRWNLQDTPPGFLRDPGLLAGVRLLGEAGLPFDACVRSWQLAELDELAAACPDTVIVLDHAGKPDVAHAATSNWAEHIAQLARTTSACCKLSGLLTEAPPHANAGDLGFVATTLFEHFGPERILWGSDWPVVIVRASYRHWLDIARELVQRHAREHEGAVFAGNASRFYRLTLHESQSQD